jgi:O-antigen/teichoic acid export membrane protein
MSAGTNPVREALKKLTGESLVYGLGAVGGRAVQLLLVPVLTRALPAGAFGVGDLVVAYSQTLAQVLIAGMDAALARFFYEQPDREARIRMASSSLVFRLVTSTAVCGLVALLAAPIASAFIGGDVYRKYVLVGAAALPFSLLVAYGNDLLRVTFQPWKFIALNVTQTVLVGGLSVWFVVGKDSGVVGMLYGRLFGDAACALLALILCRHSIRPRFSRTNLRRMLAYGVPMVPGAFAFGILASMDRYFLQRTRSLEEVGVYAVAVKFFAAVSMAVSAFQLAYMPFAFANAQSPSAPRLFARVFAAYVGAASLAALAASLFAPEALAILVPPAYRSAAVPAAWLAFAAVAWGAYAVASVGVSLALKTPWLVVCAAGAALVAFLANVVLVPSYGIAGAGAATCAGYATAALLTYLAAQRARAFPYRGPRMAALYLIALALAIATPKFAPQGAVGAAVKLGVLAGYAALCWKLDIGREKGAVAWHARA